MSPGRFIKSEHEGFEMQHRYEDRALITELLEAHKPTVAVELGTAAGGFASYLARTLEAWQGSVVTVDKIYCPNRDALIAAHPNLDFCVFDALTQEAWPAWFQETLTASTGLLVYCDNGNKPREIELVAPLLRPGSVLGTHDYWTEVPIEWVEPYVKSLGYTPLWHDRFAALADPVNYPRSLSRFWRR